MATDPQTKVIKSSASLSTLAVSLAIDCCRQSSFQFPGRMLGQHGFLAHVFSVFNKFAASVDVIATSEVTVSLTLDEGRLQSPNFSFYVA